MTERRMEKEKFWKRLGNCTFGLAAVGCASAVFGFMSIGLTEKFSVSSVILALGGAALMETALRVKDIFYKKSFCCVTDDAFERQNEQNRPRVQQRTQEPQSSKTQSNEPRIVATKTAPIEENPGKERE